MDSGSNSAAYRQAVKDVWQDLHDGIAQYVAFSRMLVEQVVESCEANPGQLSELNGDRLRMANTLLQQLQRSFNYLQRFGQIEALTENEGLFRGLQELAALVERVLEIQCIVKLTGSDSHLEPQVTRDALMIVREAVHNAQRHGNASKIQIIASVHNDRLEVVVIDNGRGFDPSKVGEGRGLGGMKSRAGQRSGELRVKSQPNKGTRISVSIPLHTSTPRT